MLKKVFIIAEAGVNHNGSIVIATKLIDAAVKAGVDAVKFQTFTAKSLVCKNAPKAQYQIRNTGNNKTQFQMIKELELDEKAHKELIKHCFSKGIQFLSSPFDFESVDLLRRLGLSIFKIPSGEITNLPYLRKIGALRKKVILSTGMANMMEIREALKILIQSRTLKKNITVLHCNTEYPTSIDDVNLKAMVTIRENFGVNVGYSDHTVGIAVSLAAVALGATIIEKHFTLDRHMKGPDHIASLEPKELSAMVKGIRDIERALGDGIKRPSRSEKKNLIIARKSIVAVRPIHKGELFTTENLTGKRPGKGISLMRWDDIIGKFAHKDYSIDEIISKKEIR